MEIGEGGHTIQYPTWALVKRTNTVISFFSRMTWMEMHNEHTAQGFFIYHEQHWEQTTETGHVTDSGPGAIDYN